MKLEANIYYDCCIVRNDGSTYDTVLRTDDNGDLDLGPIYPDDLTIVYFRSDKNVETPQTGDKTTSKT